MKTFCKEMLLSHVPYYGTFCQETCGYNEEVDILPHCHNIKTLLPLGFLIISSRAVMLPL